MTGVQTCALPIYQQAALERPETAGIKPLFKHHLLQGPITRFITRTKDSHFSVEGGIRFFEKHPIQISSILAGGFFTHAHVVDSFDRPDKTAFISVCRVWR